jgi:hypothetical protein
VPADPAAEEEEGEGDEEDVEMETAENPEGGGD